MAIGMPAIMAIGGGFSAGSSIMAGQAQAKSIQNQANFNAQVYEQQAEMIKQQKKISDYQFNRQAANARGTIISRTAGKGFAMGGSPLAILIDNESQMQFDHAINDYNNQIQQNYAMSGANYQRQTGAAQARLASYTGYTNAFSTIMNTGTQLGMLNLQYGQGGKV